jgi:anaerobic selenocysteine-containing dehydrogenase
MGAVNAPGGTSQNTNNKFVPPPFSKPPPQKTWNELLYPQEWPLAYHEMSFLLPHFLEEGRGKLAAYFTRVYNPVWTNPDGMMWERVLRDESKIELHAALTPVWSETAQYADYVLPMGNGAERHDLMSHETHAAKWIAFRQPVLRVVRERAGENVELTYQANPGEVWEEAEFWIELSWRIDPDGSLGVRKYYESPYRPGEKITLDEYYGWIFENSVPGLPEAAKKQGLTPLQYMKKYGAFLVADNIYEGHRSTGFNTPSKKLEFFSQTMHDWRWPDQALPAYIESHVHRKHLDRAKGEFVLVPTFRLPTLIHTRSANAKWLYELSNTNPVWIHPEDATQLGIKTGGLVRITTRIGHYVNKAWVTEGMRPGVVACSHHLGRWRLFDDVGTDRWASAKVAREESSPGVFRFRRVEDIRAYFSNDPDTQRIWWTDGGVHQNLAFAVQPDPVSGMHCWHQRVTVSKAHSDDRYGDIVVDTNKSMQVYREWLALARPGPGPGPEGRHLRRPMWLDRAVKPAPDAYMI